MPEREWFGTQICMGWFGNSSQKQGDEFDLGQPLLYWSNTYFSRYEYIKKYLESRIGHLSIQDADLQSKMSNMLIEDSKGNFKLWTSYGKDFVDVKTDGNNTLIQVQKPNNPKYKYQSEWELGSIVRSLRRSLHYIGFEWNRRHKTYLKRNSKMTFDEVVQAIGIDKLHGKTSGLEAYCSQVAYRQTLHGIPNTWSQDKGWLEKGVGEPFGSDSGAEKGRDEKQSDVSVDDKCTECGKEIPLLRRKALPSAKTCVNCSYPEDSKDKIEISESKSSDNPYSKVEQLEKLIALRNKGEISPEEFDNLKKELLS